MKPTTSPCPARHPRRDGSLRLRHRERARRLHRHRTLPPTPRGSRQAPRSAAATPRLALTHDGGVMVVDVASGEVVADEAMEGFVRVSPAGDGRHALVSGNLGWHVLDLGSWGHEHGDHAHHYTDDARPDRRARSRRRRPGHVVAHDGITHALRRRHRHDHRASTPTTSALTEAPRGVHGRRRRGRTTASPSRLDGPQPAADRRATRSRASGVRLVSPSGAVHRRRPTSAPACTAKATLKGEVVVFGCENGVLVYDDGEIVKLDWPGRVRPHRQRLRGGGRSPIMVADYKDDPDAEGYLLQAVALVDSEARTLEVVRLPEGGVELHVARASPAARTDEALILSADGAVARARPRDRRGITDSVGCGRAGGESPAEWQQPHPAINRRERRRRVRHRGRRRTPSTCSTSRRARSSPRPSSSTRRTRSPSPPAESSTARVPGTP